MLCCILGHIPVTFAISKNKSLKMPSLRGISLVLLLASSVQASSFMPRSSSFVTQGSIKAQTVFQKTPSLAVTGGSEEDPMTPPQTPAAPEAQAAPVPEVAPPAEPVAVAPPTTTSLLGPNAPPPGLLRSTFPKFPWHSVPNLLTYARCLAIPLLMVLFYMPESHVVTSVLFAFASFTDWLDGYLARRWDITSPFGAFLDPVADKLMVSTALILLAGRYGKAVSIPSSIILAREIAVSALREWMAQRGQRDAVKVGFQGKVKTALTMVALTGGFFNCVFIRCTAKLQTNSTYLSLLQSC